MATTVTSLEERHHDYVEKVDGQLLDIHRKANVLGAQFPLRVNSIDKLAANLTGSIQQLAGVVANVQTQLYAVLATVQATQTQLAVVAQKTDAVATSLAQTKDELRQHSLEYAGFKSESRLIHKLLQWVGGGVAAVLIGATFTVARQYGSLEEKVQHHQDTLNEIKRDLNESKSKTKN